MLASLLLASAQTVVVGILTDPVSLQPHRATDTSSAAIVANVCEPLVRQRADGHGVEPVLATTWATEDNRRWTFTLRQDVRFHDGTPFDADAVVANLELLSRVRAFAGTAERIGPHVVHIRLPQPNAALLATLSQPFFSLQSPRRLGHEEPVGTGPFRFRKRRPGRVELEANQEYWQGASALERLTYRRFSSQEALARGLVEGSIQVTAGLSQDQVDRLAENPDLLVDFRPGLNTAFLLLNNDEPLFSDGRVRQAVAHSVDRAALVADLLGGHGEPARNPLPPGLWGYAEKTHELILDRALAHRRLTAAGHGGGFECVLLTPLTSRPYMPSPLALAQHIARDLAQSGIQVHIEQVPRWADFRERLSQGDYEMALLGWQADTTDPNDFLSALLATESVGVTNRSRYSSPAMDALLKRGRMGSQLAERRTTYREVQDLFQRDMPWVPLYHVSGLTVRHRSVRGIEGSTMGILRLGRAGVVKD